MNTDGKIGVLDLAGPLRQHREALRTLWQASTPVRHFFLDNLLPETAALEVASHFPGLDEFVQRSSLGRRKRTYVQVSHFHPVVRECLYAFQEPEVVAAIEDITGHSGLVGDQRLDASGLSAMTEGDFHNPHLDNAYDGDPRLYRVLTVLFYVSPGWKAENGGSLELWDPEVTRAHSIPALFNRLVVMEMGHLSWHSVSRIMVEQPRCAVATAYFSRQPLPGPVYPHVTTSTGRPEQPCRRLALGLTAPVLNMVARLLPGLTMKFRRYVYKKQ